MMIIIIITTTEEVYTKTIQVESLEAEEGRLWNKDGYPCLSSLVVLISYNSLTSEDSGRSSSQHTRIWFVTYRGHAAYSIISPYIPPLLVIADR